jgi:hypothetical protein
VDSINVPQDMAGPYEHSNGPSGSAEDILTS